MTPKSVCSAVLVGIDAREAHGVTLCRCSAYAKSQRYIKNLQKPRKNCGFCISRVFRIASLHARKNLEKKGPGTAKTLPRCSRNPLKSSPQRPKMHKNQPRATTNAARSAKCVKEAPDSEKWCEHGVTNFEKGSGSLILWLGWPLP